MPLGNKLGDMIVELRNPNLDGNRQNDIVRILNEMGDKQEILESWVGENKQPLLNYPTIFTPTIFDGALSSIKFQRSTDTPIPTGVDTPVSFEPENTVGKSNIFILDDADPTRIKVLYAGQPFGVIGSVIWDNDATGYRLVKIFGYTEDDQLIGGEPLQSSKGFSELDNVCPFCAIYEVGQFSNLAYIKMTVAHSKGSDLDMFNFNMAIFAP